MHCAAIVWRKRQWGVVACPGLGINWGGGGGGGGSCGPAVELQPCHLRCKPSVGHKTYFAYATGLLGVLNNVYVTTLANRV